ncbi:hypothetical protein JTE90_024240 [Oedothorax gibbosus]|uniref:Large ribosomal subunit protein mL64 n=1 Tax=Oedothorax gibbosus TaxID=931172 RepID=A0AAV6TWU4_9ARAC|nr:hypothetical protein JTE90_024240 [Oedothorax gibbosus]
MASKVFLTDIFQCNIKRWIAYKNISTYRHLSSAAANEDKSEQTIDVLLPTKEQELSDEEILRKRFKSRLPERVYKMHVSKQPVELSSTIDFKIKSLRKSYARFGKASNLNPGLCWPTRDEIEETIHYDKIFEPPLQERIAKVEAKRLAEETRKKEYEAEVDENMSKLDKWMKDYHAKNAQKEEKARELRLKREQLVEEISEYLGYDIDPKDPRFKEAVEQKEKEKKKAAKAKRQQESYEKMLDKLKKIAQNK